jgi:hypothetical protein
MALGLGCWLLAVFLAWFFLTHRLERFFHQGYLLACVLSGWGWSVWRESADGARQRRFADGAAAAALALAICAYAAVWGGLFSGNADFPVAEALTSRAPPSALLRRGYPMDGLHRWMNARPPDESVKVLLLGAADPFWLPAARGRPLPYAYAVVFSEHPLWRCLRAGADPMTWARAEGYTHVYINWSEWARLHANYIAAYDLSPAEQERLADFLRRTTPVPLDEGGGASVLEAALGGAPWLRQLVKDYPGLFPNPERRATREGDRLRTRPPFGNRLRELRAIPRTSGGVDHG